jgi:hypothetical protein
MQFTQKALEICGFAGSIQLSSSKDADVPKVAGVYVVYRPTTDCPVFLSESKAGLTDQSKPADVVKRKWVDGAQVVYIGYSAVLQRRIDQCRKFGAGTANNHGGGCFIWQLGDHADLLVAWRATADGETPPAAKTALIKHFMDSHKGRMPFANHQP